ncbi:MAG: coenzyme F420-0:L-glutamate ligase [Acidobacteriota bacterium]|nr:coenzyme F420-0:L-glutamate ligase [Acidobacteriota bacterium]
MAVLTAIPVAGLPEVRDGDDLAELIAAADGKIGDEDIVVVAHKVVSKAEGRVVALHSVQPGAQARELAAQTGKDPRHVQAILDETAILVRAERGVIISRTRHGFVCANAGVDGSNAAPGTLVLLPADPDGSARALRARLRELTGRNPAILITDSFGRAWRNGQQEVAIGCAGLAVLDDWRGRADGGGRSLTATCIAIADQVASAADLVRAKDSREPVVIVGGLARHVSADDGPGARELVRAPSEDLFS